MALQLADGDPVKMAALERGPVVLWYLHAEKHLRAVLQQMEAAAAARRK